MLCLIPSEHHLLLLLDSKLFPCEAKTISSPDCQTVQVCLPVDQNIIGSCSGLTLAGLKLDYHKKSIYAYAPAEHKQTCINLNPAALQKTQCISSVLVLNPGQTQTDIPCMDSCITHTMQAMQKSLLPSQSMTTISAWRLSPRTGRDCNAMRMVIAGHSAAKGPYLGPRGGSG